MAIVGAAAPAQDRDLGEASSELGVLATELLRITGIELLRVVELGMAATGAVGTKTSDPLDPAGVVVQRGVEVGGVHAVDHEVGGAAVGGGVDQLDGVAQIRARREPAVGLDREGDGHGHRAGLGGAHHADGLGGVGQGQGRDQVGLGLGQGLDLGAVVGLGLVLGHEPRRVVAVVARAETAADHHRCLI